MNLNRRNFLVNIASLSTCLFLSGSTEADSSSLGKYLSAAKPDASGKALEVTAVEDLMREHGVLRRILFVYSETAVRPRRVSPSVAPAVLQRTARLFRAFGEDYHEKKLEETYIFPAVKKAGGDTAGLPDILSAQHKRGRALTDYILAETKGTRLSSGSAETLARILDSLVRMYRPHAAREDTLIFPAWKQTLTPARLDELNDKFETIEHQQFGEHGFEKAVQEVGEIESLLGLADLKQFTAGLPRG